MRGSVLRDGRMVYRDDLPEPVPGPGQVLVAVRSCGICGSDLHFASHGAELLSLSSEMAGGAGGMNVDLGRDVFMGHEFSAEIIEPGPDTDTHPAGSLVTSIPVLLSGTDVEAIVYSNTTVGGYAERMLLSALVLGCGPIGIAVIAALRLRGVEDIVAADFSPKRRELAAAMGARQTVDPAAASPFDSTTPAVVFEAVGVPGIIDDVIRRARHGTRLIVVGVCMQADTVYPFFAIAKELNIQFVLAYGPDEFGHSLRAIAEGDIDVRPMITGTVGLEGVGAAFDDLGDPDRHCKILVTP